MELGLRGRTAIITGSSQGIGKAIAFSLAKEGVRVAICARNSETLTAVQDEIRQLGGEAVAITADVTDPADVHKVVSRTIAEYGNKIDILINNVGGAEKFGDFLELSDTDWRDSFELNIMPIIHFVRETLPRLRLSPSPRIINLSSISGMEPGFYNPHYTIMKAAIINLSKYLANHFAKEGILVNVVCPGPTFSSSWDRNVQRIADVRGISFDEAKIWVDNEEAAKIPLGRIGTGDDVASLVTFLASDQANWITGSCYSVDGGKLRSMR
jgi:NAD(P)-dependent dehydrogenase (short-subunit alcohol dehydrogenase family)